MSRPTFSVLDVGNSSLRVGLVRGNRLRNVQRFPVPAGKAMADFLFQPDSPSFDYAVATSVVPGRSRELKKLFRVQKKPLFLAGTDLSIPLQITYRPRASVGVDRLLNALAADRRFSRRTLVVDIGTAVTFDAVDGKGSFLGGGIAPGLFAMARALSTSTALLPESDCRKPRRLLSRNTEESLRVGVRGGFTRMISGLIRDTVQEMGGKVLVVATGGGARKVVNEIPQIDQMDLNLTLSGLQILASETVLMDGR